MARPFRFRPPVLPQPTIARDRLHEAVASRWAGRVVCVRAGPGFGKTTLLAQAWSAPSPADARQAWLSCEPADESAAHLLRGIADALDLPPDADVRAVLDGIWADHPAPVGLVFDDLHEVPAGSPGASLLEQLVNELPENAHVVLSSRDRGPVPLARLVAAGQVVSIDEADLLFDADEHLAFAASRGVDPALLTSTGGWPALAELAASARGDWTLDYLREEVLFRLGPDRSRLLAAFALCGGGDDEVLAAVAGRDTLLDDVVRSIPLVTRSTDGWAALHPLWEPALRRLLSADEIARAQRAAAGVHRARGRFALAFDLSAEADDWDGALEVMCEAERRSVFLASNTAWPVGPAPAPHDFGRWYRSLPPDRRGDPAALLALGVHLQSDEPMVAADRLRLAAERFRLVGDVEGELAAVSREGLIRSWLNDLDGLLALYGRVIELAEAGSSRAQVLGAIGLATVAHAAGDSRQVLDLLTGLEDPGWMPTMQWLKSVAHRRDGDLTLARRALDEVTEVLGVAEPQLEMALLRVRWLEGDVDEVAAGLRAHHQQQTASGGRFLIREAALEAAARSAWLGDVAGARALLDAAPDVPDTPSVLADVLRAIALAAIAVEEGDDAAAALALRDLVLAGPSAVGQPGGWYWHDRATVALVHVLVPESRAAWSTVKLEGAHQVGLELAEALEAVRGGDRSVLTGLQWPPTGVVRAHLPRRWVGELLDAAADWPSARGAEPKAGSGPTAALSITALGPLTVRREGHILESPNLRRARVRELLCYLVAHRRARREQIADELWPDAADAAHNLRVTLHYLLQALEPDRERNQRPSYVLVERGWLGLVEDDRFQVDVWSLEQHLDLAAQAERARDLAGAVEHYRTVLPLWGGDPFVDVPDAMWAEPVRFQLRARYVAAALRAAEQALEAGDLSASRRDATMAITAEPTCEAAYRLLARACLAAGDGSSARAALARCRVALSDLGVQPDAATAELEAVLAGRSGAD